MEFEKFLFAFWRAFAKEVNQILYLAGSKYYGRKKNIFKAIFKIKKIKILLKKLKNIKTTFIPYELNKLYKYKND